MKRILWSLLAIAALVATSSLLVEAAKPPSGGGGGTLPPVTPAYNFDVYQDRYADLGGVLDTSTGLIWGYDPVQLENQVWSWKSESQVTPLYLNALLSCANAQTDPGKAAIVMDAYDVAAQYSWRLPTLDEARDASAKGLFTVGEGLCNKYFASPIATAPGVAYYPSNVRWTSTLGNKKGTAWCWAPGDGGAFVTNQTSGIFILVVRTHVE